VKKVRLEELWGRVGTRIAIGAKNSKESAELVGKLGGLAVLIESFIKNELRDSALAQVGDWDEEKIAFFKDAGMKHRALLAAIDQRVTDIERGPGVEQRPRQTATQA